MLQCIGPKNHNELDYYLYTTGDDNPVLVINTTLGSKSITRTSTSSYWQNYYNSYQASATDIRLRLTPGTLMAISNSLAHSSPIITVVTTSSQEHQDIICNASAHSNMAIIIFLSYSWSFNSCSCLIHSDSINNHWNCCFNIP